MNFMPQDPTAAAPQSAPAAPAPAAPEAPAAGGVAELPPIQAVLSGKPPGLLIPASDKRPYVDAIAENLPAVTELGLSVYLSKTEHAAALFNPKLISLADVQKADHEKKLDDLFPSVDTVLGAPEKATDDEAPEANAEAPATPAPGAAAPAAGVQNRLAGTRIAALNANNKPPTDRPLPAQGAILNSLTQRAV